MMNNIEVQNFNFKYSKSEQPIFENVNLTFPSGEISLLTGPSGCGKSTLLTIIAGLADNPTYRGTIKIAGNSIKEIVPAKRAKLVSMMFQDPNQQFVMQKVKEELIFALENIQTPPAEIENKVNDALAFCDIQNLADRKIVTLSGGEKQKVVLATMVALDSDIMLLDEPFASIDFPAKQAILAKLVKLQREQHKTIIISDHDLTGYTGLVEHLFRVEGTSIKELSGPETYQTLNNNYQPDIHFKIPQQDFNIEVTDFCFQAQKKTLLNCSKFKFYQGCTLLTGASGIGKSTLFRSLTKLKKYHGEVFLNTKNIKKIKNKTFYQQIALIFQNANDQFLNVTVTEELQLAQATALSDFWTEAKIAATLKVLQLDDKKEQVVYTLSGGQKKKLQILLMLIRDPQIMLLDEPFAGLDRESVKLVESLLQTEFIKRQHSLIVISHQIFQFNHFFDYHIEFANQKLTYKEAL
ncbi:ATP-binding cassette domain-containing protein [Fructilactobacillus frigidiflavus]|uniref:ATP-binding cassette domain-containing protein n=1 Tax=Fructilactobacillus frigidiflavus TaxID=3242688 RepID=UPI00375829E9